jgi:hypothetical protein
MAIIPATAIKELDNIIALPIDLTNPHAFKFTSFFLSMAASSKLGKFVPKAFSICLGYKVEMLPA